MVGHLLNKISCLQELYVPDVCTKLCGQKLFTSRQSSNTTGWRKREGVSIVTVALSGSNENVLSFTPTNIEKLCSLVAHIKIHRNTEIFSLNQLIQSYITN